MGRRGKYAISIIAVLCVYAILFELCRWETKGYAKRNDIEELLCVLSGFPPAELPIDQKMAIVKWMSGLSVIFILVGKEIYDQQNGLKYIAMVRYGSYRRFYRSLMNRTAGIALLYGGAGMLVTYVLYAWQENGQAGNMEFLEMCMVYLSQLLLLCLLQTICMILTRGYTASVILLVAWFVTVLCGHLVIGTGWIWLPPNWGMYIRSAGMVSGGVPMPMYYIQAGICVLLWAATPFVIKQ